MGAALAVDALELGAAREAARACGGTAPSRRQTVSRLRPLSRRRLSIGGPPRVCHARAEAVGACALALLGLVGPLHGTERIPRGAEPARRGDSPCTRLVPPRMRASCERTPPRPPRAVVPSAAAGAAAGPPPSSALPDRL